MNFENLIRPITIILLASGQGQRIGNSTPKQFLKLGDKKLFEYSLNTILNVNFVSRVLLVVPISFVQEIQEYVNEKYNGSKIIVTGGGNTRSESTRNALKLVEENEIVLIHDAARPFIAQKIIEKHIEKLEEGFDITHTLLKVSDSLVELEEDNNQNIKPFDRNNKFQVQTPQGFNSNYLLKAFENSNNFNSTDDIQIVQTIYPNLSIGIVQGSTRNFKVTTKEDLELAKIFVKGNS